MSDKSKELDDLLYFNGIDATTGEYVLPPMRSEELSLFVRGQDDPGNLRELELRHGQKDQRHYGVPARVDPQKLDEAGWGVIFADKSDPAIEEALQPLLDLREQQSGDLYKRLVHSGEPKGTFLANRKVGFGPVQPEKVPYYLLIVGSPEEIPFEFQSQLDVQYAVGRLHFDSVEEYANYAASAVVAERGEVRLPRQASFFGVRNDRVTSMSARRLVKPVQKHLERNSADWQVSGFLREEATKANLSRLMGGEETPALLFTASHGAEFPCGDPRQVPHQGALFCQDWPGSEAWKASRRPMQDFYFAGDDLTRDARLLGLICFSFACYGAGTPRHDEYPRKGSEGRRREIAELAFVGGLPKKLLGHPGGGDLAFLCHVERAWGFSFLWPGADGATTQTGVFESTIDRLLDGDTVGSAFEYFNLRYAELATEVAVMLQDINNRKKVDDRVLVDKWTANNDARGYVVVGDPAVRLPAASAGEGPRARPVIDLRPVARSLAVEEESGDEVAPYGTSAAGADTIHFRAYHPSALRVGERRKLLVYAHVLEALEAVAADAGETLGQEARDYRPAEAEASRFIAAGTELTIVPRAEGLHFDPPQSSLVWSEALQRADFEMIATDERAGHVSEGSIAVYVGPLLIADVRLPVVVVKETDGEAAAEEGGQTVQSATMYPSVFASYSHDDTPIVEAMETACEALGMDYLRDVMDLKSGQDWSAELLRMIERADVFQLFWSKEASRSAYVEQEWRHALELTEIKGEAFIRPVYWEQPLAPPPEALRHIHFAPLDLTAWLGDSAPPKLPALASGDVENLASLTVSTYAAADPADPDVVTLKARTEISIPGDVEVYLAEGLADEDYLAVHEKTVREALRARLAYLELVTGSKS